MSRASSAVNLGLFVTPMPTSSQVKPTSRNSAGQTLRKGRGTFRFRLDFAEARRHRRLFTSQPARVSQGQTAHHAEPRKKTEMITRIHHRFHVTVVARLRSAMEVPNRPATITARKAATKRILSPTSGQGEPVRTRTSAPTPGAVARLTKRAGAGRAEPLIVASTAITPMPAKLAKAHPRGSPAWVMTSSPSPPRWWTRTSPPGAAAAPCIPGSIMTIAPRAPATGPAKEPTENRQWSVA